MRKPPTERGRKIKRVWIACEVWFKRTGIAPTLPELQEVMRNDTDIAQGTIRIQRHRWMDWNKIYRKKRYESES
jgi:hypothetical protein